MLEHKREAMTRDRKQRAKTKSKNKPKGEDNNTEEDDDDDDDDDDAPPPLTLASSYEAVPANFSQPDWDQKLRDAGHDGSQPTVWVLEGLLYYLAPVRR